MFSCLAAISQQQVLCDQIYKFQAWRSTCLCFYTEYMFSICPACLSQAKKTVFLVSTIYCSILHRQINGHICYSDGVLIWIWCSPVKQKAWGAKTRHAPRRTWNQTPVLRTEGGQEANIFYNRYVQTLSCSWTWSPRGAVDGDHTDGNGASGFTRRLMLHIKQTKENANLIVSHSLLQPNISKSDSLSLSQSKTLYNQIFLNLFCDLWSGKVSLSFSKLLKRSLFVMLNHIPCERGSQSI